MGVVFVVIVVIVVVVGGDMSCMDVLFVGIISVNVKLKYVGEIVGMKRMFGVSMSSLIIGEM